MPEGVKEERCLNGCQSVRKIDNRKGEEASDSPMNNNSSALTRSLHTPKMDL
jgi:hypothetical protein